MKKIIIFACLAALPIINANAQFKRKSNHKNNNTAQTVALPQEKIAESWWCYAIFDNHVAEENVKIADLDYRNGKIEQWEVFDQKGELDYTFLFDQDPSSNQIKRYIRAKDNKITLDYTETYNSLQQLVQRDIYDDDKKQIVATKTWEYNALGQIVRQIDIQIINGKLSPSYEITYEHNTDINSCLETHINHRSQQSHQIAITYNEYQKPTEEAHYKTTGELVGKTTYYYDEQNRLIEKRFYPDGNNIEVRETYAYNALNNEVIQATYIAQGEQLAEYIVKKFEFK
jgi:V8-like Glu-specific endopeptidase